jgi:hypothetical protein
MSSAPVIDEIDHREMTRLNLLALERLRHLNSDRCQSRACPNWGLTFSRFEKVTAKAVKKMCFIGNYGLS